MPFCPKCRYEYESGVSTCPDCDETLVSTLPESKPEPEPFSIPEEYQDWVQLARLTSFQSAQMVQEAWRARDIPGVVLSGAGHFGQTGQMGPSSFRPVDGAYSMMVPPEHVVNADIEAAGILGEEWSNALLVDVGAANGNPPTDTSHESSTLPLASFELAEDDDTDISNWIELARLTSYASAVVVIEAWRSNDIRGVMVSGKGLDFKAALLVQPPSQTPGSGHYYSMVVPEEHIINADAEASIVLGEEWEKAKLYDIE